MESLAQDWLANRGGEAARSVSQYIRAALVAGIVRDVGGGADSWIRDAALVVGDRAAGCAGGVAAQRGAAVSPRRSRGKPRGGGTLLARMGTLVGRAAGE